MTSMVEMGLIGDPFALVPTAKVVHWAGRPEVRDLLLDIARSVRIDDSGLSEFVVLHGDWGAGKTHALRYLLTAINDTEKNDFESLALYVAKIKVGPKLSFLELYKRLMQDIGPMRIREIARTMRARVDAAAESLSSTLSPNEVFRISQEEGGFQRLALESCPPEDQPMIRLLLAIAEGNDTALAFLGGGKAPPSHSGFTQPVSTDFDAVHVFATFCRAITQSIGEQPPVFKAVHLLVDEAEDALQAKAAEQSELWGSIRELVNQVPYGMALLLAFTAEAAFLEAVMPEAVLERTTRRNIELQALDPLEAKEFLREHLAHYRPPGFQRPEPYYPFTEDSVDVVLEREPILVPRKMFRNLRQILNRAVKKEGIAPGEMIDGRLAVDIIEGLGL